MLKQTSLGWAGHSDLTLTDNIRSKWISRTVFKEENSHNMQPGGLIRK